MPGIPTALKASVIACCCVVVKPRLFAVLSTAARPSAKVALLESLKSEP